MPRSRATELSQPPLRRAPHSLRTSSSSDSDPVHIRSRTTERSPRLSYGRSPRAVSQSEPLNQRKLGSRIADLESQLGQAQDELKSLKNQLASAEVAKLDAQQLLYRKSRKPKRVSNSEEIQVKQLPVTVQYQDSNKKCNTDKSKEVEKETYVFEVPVEKEQPHKAELPPESLWYDELALKNDELASLKSKLHEKDKEMEALREENAKMKSQLHEKLLKISSGESQREELTLRLKQADQELEKSKASEANMNDKVEATERAKEELESEMKRLGVQTEQWRKAADAAATVLAGEVEKNGRKVSERCESMEDSEDVYGGAKRRESSIKKIGDLWRKKANK